MSLQQNTAKSRLDSIRKSTAHFSRTVIVLLYSALDKAQLEFCVMFFAPHYKKIMTILKCVQQGVMKMIKEMKQVMYRRRPTAETAWPGEYKAH